MDEADLIELKWLVKQAAAYAKVNIYLHTDDEKAAYRKRVQRIRAIINKMRAKRT